MFHASVYHCVWMRDSHRTLIITKTTENQKFIEFPKTSYLTDNHWVVYTFSKMHIRSDSMVSSRILKWVIIFIFWTFLRFHSPFSRCYEFSVNLVLGCVLGSRQFSQPMRRNENIWYEISWLWALWVSEITSISFSGPSYFGHVSRTNNFPQWTLSIFDFFYSTYFSPLNDSEFNWIASII